MPHACHDKTHHHAMHRSLWIAVVFMLLEVIAGWIANSLALISDAMHLFTDVGALLLGIIVARMAKWPATPTMSYGYHRAEILGALVSAASLWALSGVLIYESIHRFFQPEVVDGADQRQELIEVDRLGDVAVGVEVVALDDVLLRRRAGQDHHRDAPQRGICLDLREYLVSGFPGEIQVEQNQIGPRRTSEAAFAPQKFQRFDAIADQRQTIPHGAFGQSGHGPSGIDQAVFD